MYNCFSGMNVILANGGMLLKWMIEWIDNDTVSINDVILNLPEDTYDWRNE